MGRNLALNMGDKGIEVSVYNKTTKKTEDFIEKEVGHRKIFGYGSLEEFVYSLRDLENPPDD